MKVQMQGQSLRVRISESELARLQAGEAVGNLTRLPGGEACRHEVGLVEGDEPALLAAGGGWILSLPRVLLEPYVARLPCRDGLAFRLPVEGSELEVDFEVDVRDSVRSRGTPRRGAQSPGGADRDSG
jgi:hypothetical protein